MTATDFGLVFNVNFNIAGATNVFAFYVGALFFLAFFLSVFVASLHVRQDSVVYPLTRPKTGMYFTEYIVLIKTSLRLGSSFDMRGRVILQLIGNFADSVPLTLKKGKGIEYFLERGTSNIFVYHSPYDLGQINQVKITMVNDAPHEIPYVDWRPSYISVMHPETKRGWSCSPNMRLRCFDFLNEEFDCLRKTKDKYSCIKSLCLFHMWFSMFHSPVRFGMYNNLVNAIVGYFILSCILFNMLVVELSLNLGVVSGAPSFLVDNRILRIMLAIGIVWLTEICVDCFLRNTVSRVSATRFNLFHGLLEPVTSLYGLRDFTVDYNWDYVRPLIPYKTVTVPMGNIHDSAHMIFSMTPPHSYYNFWGLMTLEEEREADWFCRSMNICSLNLPMSMRWVGKEAWGVKEDSLVKHFLASFKEPVCYFCLWLLDWPMHYVDEPQQAGLIFSHILCKDVTSISKMLNKTQQARLAQLCVHQWHGLLCCILVHIIKQTVEQRNESSNAIKSFIHRTMTRFGKRSAREIQATWKARQMHLKEMEISNLHKRNIEIIKEVPDEDENESARPTSSNGPLSLVRNLWHTLVPKVEPTEPTYELPELDSDSLLNLDYQEDHLLFDNFVDLENEEKLGGGDGEKLENSTELGPPREMPLFCVLREDDSGRKRTTEDSVKTRKRNKPIRSKKPGTSVDKKELKDIKSDSVSVDLNMNYNVTDDLNKDKTSSSELTAGYSNNTSQGTNISTIDVLNTGTDALSGHVNLGYVNRNVEESEHPGLNINFNARNAVIGQTNINSNSEANNSEIPDVQKRKSQEDGSGVGDKKKDAEAAKQLEENKKLQPGSSRFDSEDKERMRMYISEIEQVSLGPPFDPTFAREKDKKYPSLYMRHKNEYLSHCCPNKRCQAFADIHRKIGHTSLEVLKKILLDLLYFAMDSRDITERSKMWLRKKMVLKMFESMEKKSTFYDNYMFQGNKSLENTGFMVNQLLSNIFSILKLLLKMSLVSREEAKYFDLKERKLLYGIAPRPVSRCLFCAKKMKYQNKYIDVGCDKMEKLVKFFVRDTVYVSEREINMEFNYKVSLQRYCAMTMNLAKREIQMELEDPPMVLASKVTRAMIYKELDDLVPKHTDFKDMTADELRRVGTRRERIQARHDPSAGSSKKESMAQKRRKQMIQSLLEDLNNKWRVSVKENELYYCTQLLAQCLVQERILGFSIYSGFISKEHEILLDNSRARLAEIEKKSYQSILKVAKNIMKPLLKKALESGNEIDVLFSRAKLETTYVLEAINVAQVSAEPVFLKTCCFYVNDIVQTKVEEFKEFFYYMKTMKPSAEMGIVPKLKMMRAKYKIDEKFFVQQIKNHAAIASPVLRWGPVAIKGVPPLPDEIRNIYESSIDFETLLPQVIEAGFGDSQTEEVITKMLQTRKKLNGFVELQSVDKNRKLQLHLARVQARLTEQIALASQSIAEVYVVETDFQREYHRDELFNVELFATGHLKANINNALGMMLLFVLVAYILIMIFFTTFKASHMELDHVKIWFVSTLYGFLMYGFLFEPIKCLLYSLLNLYVDS